MISVCIATHNGEKYIRQQIDSILPQLSKSDEIIISDANSKDETIKIIKSLNDERIKIFNLNHLTLERHRHSKNHYNVTINFENALNHAKGDCIFLSDQDDIWKPNKVSIVLPYLIDGSIVQSNYSTIDGESNCIEFSHFDKSPIKNFIFNLLHQPFHGCCMAFPRSLLLKAMPFPKNLIMHDNWLGLLGQGLGYKIHYINEPLVGYRRYSGNVSPTKSKNPLFFKISYRLKLLCQILNRLYNTK